MAEGDKDLYDVARRVTDGGVLGDGTYAEVNAGTPDPNVQPAVAREGGMATLILTHEELSTLLRALAVEATGQLDLGVDTDEDLARAVWSGEHRSPRHGSLATAISEAIYGVTRIG